MFNAEASRKYEDLCTTRNNGEHYTNIMIVINYYRDIYRDKKQDELHILKHLIELMGEVSFNFDFENIFLDPSDNDDIDDENQVMFSDKFVRFHKSMRQNDFYQIKMSDQEREYISSGLLDMIFYNFIHISDVPQEIMYKLYKIYKYECRQY